MNSGWICACPRLVVWAVSERNRSETERSLRPLDKNPLRAPTIFRTLRSALAPRSAPLTCSGPCHWKNSPTAWGCYQHTLLLDWYSAGDEQSWFPSNMMLGIEVHQTREYYFSREDWVLPHRHKDRWWLVECCSDVCPSVDFSYLHIWSWSSSRVTIRFFVTTLTKALLHQLLSLAKRPALGRVLVVSNFFH